MPTYTFFPCLESQVCLTFMALDLPDDEAAMGHAALVLAEHASASQVQVWRGEQQVGVHRRAQTPRGGVLIVEDCFLQAETLRLALRDAGYDNVRCHGTERQAIASLEAGPPYLALVDLDLGNGPAYAVAEALERLSTPFLFVTAYDPEFIAERWRGIPYVGKPVSGPQVVRASEALLTARPARPSPHTGASA